MTLCLDDVNPSRHCSMDRCGLLKDTESEVDFGADFLFLPLLFSAAAAPLLLSTFGGEGNIAPKYLVLLALLLPLLVLGWSPTFLRPQPQSVHCWGRKKVRERLVAGEGREVPETKVG